MPETLELRPLRLEDLPEVAEIHILAFPKSALTRLGKETVRRYYEWQLVGPHDLAALGAFSEGRMAGFCFAGSFDGAIIGFLRRNKAFLLWQGITHFWLFTDDLFRSRVKRAATLFIRKLLPQKKPSLPNKDSSPIKSAAAKREAAPNNGSAGQELREFGILSIAVNPAFQGKGIGKALMNESERAARERGYTAMGLNVATNNQQAIRFYQSLGWEKTMSDAGDWKGKMKKYFDIEEKIC